MSKRNSHIRGRFFSNRLDDVRGNEWKLFLVAIVAIFLAVFVFILPQKNEHSIARSEALTYEGRFDRYTSSKNYFTIYLTGGYSHELYPHIITDDILEKIEAIPKGTELYFKVNPNNRYVIELKTDSEEILNFDKTQKAIAEYDKNYIILGIVICTVGVFLILYVIFASINAKKQEQVEAQKTEIFNSVSETMPLDIADTTAKARILLKAEAENLLICYQRVKRTNELVINGNVYDRKKALIEFPHSLSAKVAGHIIEVGLSKDDYSYIEVDGDIIEGKQRFI